MKNVYIDKAVVPGGGAFEIAAYTHLMDNVKNTIHGKAQLGVEGFANSLLVIPKVNVFACVKYNGFKYCVK